MRSKNTSSAVSATESVLKPDRPPLLRADRLHGGYPSASSRGRGKATLHELPDERELVPTVRHLRFLCLFAAILILFYPRIFCVHSRSLFVCIRGRFLFVYRNRGPGFAGVEDDELDWLIGGESAMNCAHGFTQSLTCVDCYMLVRSLFLDG